MTKSMHGNDRQEFSAKWNSTIIYFLSLNLKTFPMNSHYTIIGMSRLRWLRN